MVMLADAGELVAERPAGEVTYAEFMRGRYLSAGLATWPAGSTDDQGPHTEDEIYHVLAGRAVFSAGGATHPVVPGSVIYVSAGLEHRFQEIEEDLHVLVFWGPPEDSLSPTTD